MDPATNGAAAPGAGTALSADITLAQAVGALTRRRQSDGGAAAGSAAAGGASPETSATSRDGRVSAESERASSAQDATQHDAGPARASARPVPGEAETADPDAEAQDAHELPPIAPPRSWSNEDKELFASLPRETQERLAERERSRESDFLRRQNEAAVERKAAEAERGRAEAARAQFEQASLNALQLVQAELARDFPDTRTHEDAARLANDDPLRWAQWKQRVDNLQSLHGQVVQIEAAREHAQQQAFHQWAEDQDRSFNAQFREFDEPEKGDALRSSTLRYLTDVVGVPRDALAGLAGHPLFRDVRMQRIVYDAMRFHAAQEKAKSAKAAGRPPVQRPGTAAERPTSHDSTIKALEAKLANATSTREQIAAAAALRAAKRSAS